MSDERVEILAKACHSSLKTWLSLNGQTYAIPRWDRLSIEDKDFARQVTTDLLWEMCQFDLEPEHVHEIWLERRRRMGYVVGPRRNRSLRQHPNMIPYGQLLNAERAKPKIILETLRLLGTIVIEDRSHLVGSFKSYG